MLSFKELMILSASACFLRSISRTAAGALLTNFSLLSFFNTPCRNPSLCFSSASIRTSGRITENVFEQDMEIPLTRQPELTPPPPPQVTPINDVLTIIDNDATAEETNFASSEETGEDVVIKHIPVTVDEEVVVEDDIFVVVEENPQFPNGGTAGLLQYLGKNIKYPTIPQENGTQGRVTVQFVVNKDGSIVDVKVIRGVDPYLDKEAVRVISTMPKWIPGKQRGVPVRCKFTVPVTFKLQ